MTNELVPGRVPSREQRLPNDILIDVVKWAVRGEWNNHTFLPISVGTNELDTFKKVSPTFNFAVDRYKQELLYVTEPGSFDEVLFPDAIRYIIFEKFYSDVAEMTRSNLPRFTNLHAMSVLLPSMLRNPFLTQGLRACITKLEICSAVSAFRDFEGIFSSDTFPHLAILFWRRGQCGKIDIDKVYKFVDDSLDDHFANVRFLARILRPAKELRVVSLDLFMNYMPDVGKFISAHPGHAEIVGYRHSHQSKPLDCATCRASYNNGAHTQNELVATKILAEKLPLLEQVYWGDIWSAMSEETAVTRRVRVLIGNCRSRPAITISREEGRINLKQI